MNSLFHFFYVFVDYNHYFFWYTKYMYRKLRISIFLKCFPIHTLTEVRFQINFVKSQPLVLFQSINSANPAKILLYQISEWVWCPDVWIFIVFFFWKWSKSKCALRSKKYYFLLFYQQKKFSFSRCLPFVYY